MRYLIQMRLTRYFNHKMIYKKTIFKRIEDSLVLVYSIFSFLLNINLYIYILVKAWFVIVCTWFTYTDACAMERRFIRSVQDIKDGFYHCFA